MVSVRILSRFDEDFSEDKLEVDNRKIRGGPLYPVDEVLGLLESKYSTQLYRCLLFF